MSEEFTDFDYSTIPATEEMRTRLIKHAISTEEGWKALALAILGSKSPNAHEQCVEKLRQIAGDASVLSISDHGAAVEVKVGDLLHRKLNETIALVKLIEGK